MFVIHDFIMTPFLSPRASKLRTKALEHAQHLVVQLYQAAAVHWSTLNFSHSLGLIVTWITARLGKTCVFDEFLQVMKNLDEYSDDIVLKVAVVLWCCGVDSGCLSWGSNILGTPCVTQDFWTCQILPRSFSHWYNKKEHGMGLICFGQFCWCKHVVFFDVNLRPGGECHWFCNSVEWPCSSHNRHESICGCRTFVCWVGVSHGAIKMGCKLINWTWYVCVMTCGNRLQFSDMTCF